MFSLFASFESLTLGGEVDGEVLADDKLAVVAIVVVVLVSTLVDVEVVAADVLVFLSPVSLLLKEDTVVVPLIAKVLEFVVDAVLVDESNVVVAVVVVDDVVDVELELFVVAEADEV